MLASLLRDYMQETFRQPWGGSTEAIRRDGFGLRFNFLVAETSPSRVVGFGAWALSYDLHWCLTGGEIVDLFVTRELRGRGTAPLLIAGVAERVRQAGGSYLKGQAVQTPGVERLYGRLALTYPGADCIVSGRAFRALADLHSRSARELIASLPPKAWNREP